MGRTAPGGDNLTAQEETMIGNLQAGTYQDTTPTGLINGANTAYTLAATPSPTSSLVVWLNGVRQKGGGEDYTLAGDVVTFVSAPLTNSILLANFLVDTDT